MLFALISDTHYGFSPETHFLVKDLFFEIVEKNPDVILHAGDWASTTSREMSLCIRMLRKMYKGTIVSVRTGNHDVWRKDISSRRPHTLEERIRKTDRLFNVCKVRTKLVLGAERILIVGYSGWYNSINPPSNDCYWIPPSITGEKNIHTAMKKRAEKEWTEALKMLTAFEFDGWTKIVLTHFNVTPFLGRKDNPFYDAKAAQGMSGDFMKFVEMRRSGVNMICYGHTHVEDHSIIDGIQMLNSGSDYNKPAVTFFEVNDGRIQIHNRAEPSGFATANTNG